MAVYAFNKPADSQVEFVSESLKNGISRFGWSYEPNTDLRLLKDMPYSEMDNNQKNVWSNSRFLLNVREGDWIVHINVPKYGICTAGKVLEPYSFEPETEINDFRHYFKLDSSSLIQFDRNDKNVHPIISRKLKLQGKWWTIYNESDFHSSIKNLSEAKIELRENESKEEHYLKIDTTHLVKELTKKIHTTHQGKNLERLIGRVFECVPKVKDVEFNGLKGGADYGADLIVYFDSGIDSLNLMQQEKIVVQIKSFSGDHSDLSAIDQIKNAIKHFGAYAGVIVTTGNPTLEFEQKVEDLSNEIEKPVSLLAGTELSKFILKHGSHLIME